MDIIQSIIQKIPVEDLVGQVVSDIRFRSDFSDEKSVLNSQEIADLIRNKPIPPGTPPSTTKQILGLLKPTVIIKSKLMGDRVYAPYGVSNPISSSIWKNRIGLMLTTAVVVLVGTGFALGRITKK